MIAKNKGIYSEEERKFLEFIKNNSKISIDKIDKDTIIEIDKYINNMSNISKDILRESLMKNIKGLEMDISSYIAITIGLASLEVAVIPMIIKYIKIPLVLEIAYIIQFIILIMIIFNIVQIHKFYIKRKEQVLFYKFSINRLNKN